MSYLPKRPRFTGPVEGFVVNFLRANYWRVKRSMEYEDCMQEAYCVFLRVRRKYPDIEMGPHFMQLFKISWINEFNDLATADTKIRAQVGMPTAQDEDGGEHELDLPGALDNDGALSVAMRQAPAEVKAVLALFLNAPAEVLEIALRGWNGRNRKTKAGGSEAICRLVGIDPSIDVLRQTEEYFTRT